MDKTNCPPFNVENVMETEDYEKVNAALSGGYVLLSVGTDPHGGHHYSLGAMRSAFCCSGGTDCKCECHRG